MPAPAPSHNDPLNAQPVAKNPPKPPDAVLADSEAQWIFSDQELARSPSVEDGMSPEQERELRSKGLSFIMQVGIMLKLPQLTLSTAGVFFNRFLMRHSLVNNKDSKALHHYQIAAVAVFLATKTEENVRKMKELILACCRVAQKNPSLMIEESSKDFWRWRDTLLMNEDIMLEALCFDLTVDSPHRLVWELLKSLGAEHNKKLRAAAWSFLNDSCMTQLCLQFRARTIAAAAVYAAAKFCGEDTKFPDDDYGRPWWEARGVDIRDIRGACNAMTDLYEHDPTKFKTPASENTDGEGIQSIYVGLRSPIDGDEDDAKTRLRRARQEPPEMAEQAVWEGPALTGPERDEAARNRTATAEAASLKRDRDGTPKSDAGRKQHNNGKDGQRSDDAANKKPRIEVNGNSAGPKASRSRALAPEEDDGGSEEGELDG